MELWVDIQGYEGAYQVSSLGKVRHVSGRLLQTTWSSYRYVSLWKNGKKKNYSIHRLVAINFIPNPNNYPNVLHRKNDRLNNSVENLKWGTQKDNMHDAINDGTHHTFEPKRGVAQWNAKLTDAKVREIRSIVSNRKWISQESLAKQFGISRGTLRSLIAGKSWRHV